MVYEGKGTMRVGAIHLVCADGRDTSGPYLDSTHSVGYTILQMGHWKISRFLSIYL
jgi:hypothetical protein